MAQQGYENVCRVCLRSNLLENNKGMSLFQEYKDSLIADHINSLTNVEVKKNDGLPEKICPDCLIELDAALNFKQKCETSNAILHRKDKNLLENCDVKLEIDTNDIKKEDIDEMSPSLEVEYLENIYFDDTDAEVIKIEKPSRAIDLKLICDDCGGSFPSKCKLGVHWKKVHLHEQLICQTCKRAFKSYKTFHRHLKSNLKACVSMKNVNIQGTGKSRLYLCRNCPYSSKRNKDMQCHLLTHSGEKPVKCLLCHRQYTQVGSLHSHMEHAHGKIKKEITCQYCGKIVKGRSRVYKHLKGHNAVEVQCDICKKMFKDKTTLSTHMVRHTGIKSYTCDKCAKMFFTLAELCTHKRLKHIGFWFKCEFCEYKSRKSAATKNHQAKHTGTNAACIICGIFFENALKLAQHLPRHSESEKKNQCPHCDKKFYKKDSIRKHIKAKHNVILSRQVPIKNEVNEYDELETDLTPTEGQQKAKLTKSNTKH